MERELTWPELEDVLNAYETHHNYTVLKDLCNCYYPAATRVVVRVVQEYDDAVYFSTFDASNLHAYEGDKELSLSDDEVSLLVLLGASPELKADLAAAEPDDPAVWLNEQFYDEVNELQLGGIGHGYDLEVDLTAPPPNPKKVYVKEGDRDALSTDESVL